MLDQVVFFVFVGGIAFMLAGGAFQLMRERNWSKAALLGGMCVIWVVAFVGARFWGWQV
jgi:hypothetical protein